MATNYTPLTALDDITMRRLNSIFAELDSAISGGSLSGVAGEALSERDFVYLGSDGSWYQIDTDATGDIAVGALRGCVVESGGISYASSGTIKLSGTVGGFSGLTPWGRVYASPTAGGYTQTKPVVSAGGSQVAIVELGFAISATEILLRSMPVVFAKRANLADDGTLTIEHFDDATPRLRRAVAYVATDISGVTLAEYADSNQDGGVEIEGPTLAGDSITITASGTTSAIGDVSDTEYRIGQSFTTVNGGLLTSFTFELDPNSGSPSGDIHWEIRNNGASQPGTTVLGSGDKTPTANATNTVSGLSIALAPGTVYWLVLYADAQATNARYVWQAQSTSSYAGGNRAYSTNGGSSWTTDAYDSQCSFTISATTEKDRLAQSFEVTGSQTVAAVRLYLKKTGSPTGTMTLRIETDNSGEPSGTLADANLTVTVAESGLGTSYAMVDFTFGTPAGISGATPYWIVLDTDRAQSDSNYVTWGSDGSTPSYADGEMLSDESSSWGAESKDAIFEVVGEGTQYDEPLAVGSVTGDSEEMGVRFDDGAGSDADTMTTFKNLTGGTADIVCEVWL